MSPERSNSQLSPDPPKSKPYNKASAPAVMEEITNTAARHSSVPAARAEFPTRAQYLEIEDAYINSLHPRRQAKALISKDLFRRIWDVLARNPENSQETAQFRFWARRKFTLAYTGDAPITDDDFDGPPPPNAVLIHQDRIVAIQEDIYDIICEKHAAVNHGGRDKTAAAIRKNYIWLPKELVANFVKLCPRCIIKKCGIAGSQGYQLKSPDLGENDGSLSPVAKHNASLQNQNNGYSPALGSTPLFGIFGSSPIGSSENGKVGAHSPLSGSPLVEQSASPPQAYNSFALLRENNWSAPASLVESQGGLALPGPLRREGNHSAPPAGSSGSGLHSLPMSREVSLYQGLPNGWQFQHRDYPSAHDAFIKHEEDFVNMHPVEPVPLPAGRRLRPRIPSLAPIVATPSQEDDESVCYVKEEPSEDFQQLQMEFPPLAGPAGDLGKISLPLPQSAMAVADQALFQLGFQTMIPGANPEVSNSIANDILDTFLRFKDNMLDAADSPSTPSNPPLVAMSPLSDQGTPGQPTPTCRNQGKFKDTLSSSTAAQFELKPGELEELAEKMKTSASLEETCDNQS